MIKKKKMGGESLVSHNTMILKRHLLNFIASYPAYSVLDLALFLFICCKEVKGTLLNNVCPEMDF